MVSSLDSVVRRPRTWVCWEVGWKVHAIRSKLGWEDYVTTSHRIHPNHGQHASHPHPRIPTCCWPACSCMDAPLSHLHGHVPPCAHHIHATCTFSHGFHLDPPTWIPLTLIASVPTCISPHRYVLSPHMDSHPFMIVTPSHLTRMDTWMPTCMDTWIPTR